MEHNDCHLDSFISSLAQYLNEVLIHKNCVLSTFRKHNIKNEDDVEFSFVLKSAIDSSRGNTKSYNQINSSCLAEEELRRFELFSEYWCLHLANVSFRESKLCMKLNRPHTFSAIIKVILDQTSNYGKKFGEKQLLRLTSDDIGTSDLTGYRLSLLKIVAENLLETAGYKLSSSEGTWIHFTTKNFKDCNSKINILCGAVINLATKVKETQKTSNDYRRICLRDLQTMAENKNSEVLNEHLLKSLSDTNFKISLLQVKANQTVSLNFNSNCTGPRETGSKGGIFLQYNASRLAAIRKKYMQHASEGLYPIIPKPEDVDFAVLKEPEEWALLFNFLLEYPSMINKIGGELANGKANVHLICDFLLKMSSLFSIYYRRVRILLEPRDHLLQTIHGRLLLVMCVEQVLENGLALFNIQKIEEM